MITVSPGRYSVNHECGLRGQTILPGDGAVFSKGDFAALSPFESNLGKGYGVTFFGKWGDYDRSSPKPATNVGVADFYSAVEKAGLRMTAPAAGFKLGEGAFLLATIAAPEAFDAAFPGEGKVARGQLVVLKPGSKGTTSFLGPGTPPPSRRFLVSEGKVFEVR